MGGAAAPLAGVAPRVRAGRGASGIPDAARAGSGPARRPPRVAGPDGRVGEWRGPGHRPRAARLGPVRLRAGVLLRDGAARDATAALRPASRCADPAVRPLQPAHAPARGGLPVLD